MFEIPENWYYNFAFTNIDIKTTCRNAKPSGDIMQGMSSFDNNVNNDYNLAETNGITYPIVSRHFFTNGKLVVMVLEVKTGVYRHHAFGKFEMFGNGNGGEFVGGTAASKINNTARVLPKQTYIGNYNHIQTGYLVHPFLFGLTGGYDASSATLTSINVHGFDMVLSLSPLVAHHIIFTQQIYSIVLVITHRFMAVMPTPLTVEARYTLFYGLLCRVVMVMQCKPYHNNLRSIPT